MVDEDRIKSAANLLLKVLEEEAPACPYCSNKMCLCDDHELGETWLRSFLDDDEDVFTLVIHYECCDCESETFLRKEIFFRDR